jgi:CheY-like chemotaxis protein
MERPHFAPDTKKYYIVDDDIDDQQYLIEALTENDRLAQCYTANNGQEAITYLESIPTPFPDVIFLDLNMPRMGGKQCLTALKLIPRLSNIPVIIYSTSSDEREIADTIQMGAAHFLVKGSNFGVLRQELTSILATL